MKKSVTMITLLLLIAGVLSGCGNDSNGNRQDESVQTAEPTAETEYEEPTIALEAKETQPKFDVAQDVLLSYEYDSNGEISKVVFTHRVPYTTTEIAEFSEIKTTYDTNGYLTSITTETKPAASSTGYNVSSIEAKYNTDGQIISLTCTSKRSRFSDRIDNYEVVYNSSDNYIKVYINGALAGEITEIYDSNCKLLSREWFDTSTDKIIRRYEEYVNGILSHEYRYNDSTGQLLSESIYHDNGNRSESYTYDEETGEIENHYRYDRNGDLIR